MKVIKTFCLKSKEASQFTIDRQTSRMSPLEKCSKCPMSLLGEGMGEHLRLMHQVRRPSVTSQLKTTSGELQAMSNGCQTSERHKVELEELAAKQEQCVMRVVEENKEQEKRSLKKQKVMEDVLKRIDWEKQEKLKKESEERNRKQREKQKMERKERKQELEIQFDKQIKELKVTLEAKFLQENADAEEFLQWEKKIWEDAQNEALQKEREEGENELEKKREELNEEKNLRTKSLSLLLKENEDQRKTLLLKQKEEMDEEIGSTKKRKRGSDEGLITSNKPPCPPECPVCFNQMAPPIKIFQCSNGHHICEPCKS